VGKYSPGFSCFIPRGKKKEKEKGNIWYHKTIIQQDIIIDQHLLQIREASTTIHEIKGNKIIQQLATKDYDRKELILDGWIIINGKEKA
jgi:hypothetical protein